MRMLHSSEAQWDEIFTKYIYISLYNVCMRSANALSTT